MALETLAPPVFLVALGTLAAPVLTPDTLNPPMPPAVDDVAVFFILN